MSKFKAMVGAMAICLAAASVNAATVAYDVATGQAGNQDYTGVLGMLFTVNSAIKVDSLGVFDDLGNGITQGTTLTVELWSRTGLTGGLILASETFTMGEGSLSGSSLFKSLASAVTLLSGDYAIVSYGYNANDLNGNKGIGGSNTWTTNGSAGAISFVGSSLFGGPAGATIGTNVDGGPDDRYAAGTFSYSVVPVPAAGLLLLTALGGLAGMRRRKAKAA